MASVEDAIATLERNIEATSGQPVAVWVGRIQAQGLTKHGEMVAWLKAEHGFGHGYANHVAKCALAAATPRSADDPVAHLFEGKAQLRPLYDALVAVVMALGPDVEMAPKKANVSIRRRKQFALIQPSTRTRLDLGLVLKAHPPEGRLEASGSFNAMFTHRVRLEAAADLDADVLAWLREAYDEAV
ncbi:DUF5655 domain-containing protein [Nitrospirillum sp. BR 11164]|uniref:DUF5655 domain-containing protein n=1 Tax=Nitrospirillum sp. BR 11164 TaxID=3104324 RepID=UPI002AFF3D70|nr:DUF5655 domain-containing protein [Nitrospirillum sp. BR 11164]MEA1651040.1 DUF5655 domain-containing protein [Nitrospirillum sp. BR 11164]